MNLFSFPSDLSLVGLDASIERFDERRLSRAILAEQRMDCSFRDGQGYLIIGVVAAIAFGQSINGNQSFRHGSFPLRWFCGDSREHVVLSIGDGLPDLAFPAGEIESGYDDDGGAEDGLLVWNIAEDSEAEHGCGDDFEILEGGEQAGIGEPEGVDEQDMSDGADDSEPEDERVIGAIGD